jgi:YebC/PmpR family DNA-binding regulatory protein
MSGHSHWSNIKRQKGRKDKKRAKKFSKLSRKIITAVKEGGKDPSMNSSLKLAIEKAREEDMPKDNIEKAIKKGAGEGKEGELKDFILEVYGPKGLAIILKGSTDNKNRTVSEVNQILKQSGGKLAKPGSVNWLFDKKGVIEIDNSEENQLIAIDAGAETIEGREDSLIIYTKPENLNKVKNSLDKKLEINSYDLGYKPKRKTKINNKIDDFLEKLEDHDEIDQIYFTTKD